MAVIHSLYREAGVVEIDESTCTKCGQCCLICPGEVLKMEERHVRVVEDTAFGCIACGHCMMVCPEGSITVTGRGLSPDDLRPISPREELATADELEALMRSRRSVRRFTDREVDVELLDRIVEMFSTAPMGIPPWDVGCVTIQGRDRVGELSSQIIDGYEAFLRISRPWVLTVMRPFTRRAVYDQFASFIRPLAELLVEGRRAGRDLLFYDAPVVMIFHHSPYADASDPIIACTYAMLSAESLGLGTTMIGSAAPILARNRKLCRELGIPEGNKPAIALIVGYPATSFKRTIHRKFSDAHIVS